MSIQQLTPHDDLERLSDVVKLSAHVTRMLGQNPSMMTLQGTNSYLLQPPSNNLAPLILIDTSSPHTAQQYVDMLMTHLFHLGLASGVRETHFESVYAKQSLRNIPEDRHDAVKAQMLGERADDPYLVEMVRKEYGSHGRWEPSATKQRRLPAIEHIILTHRHLDHVGALPLLLTTLKDNGLPPPKIWKFPSPDEAELTISDRDRPTTDTALLQALPQGTYQPFSPFQPLHPVMPGLMISIIDPVYKHLLKHDKDGKPKWNEVPEIARVSVRCLRTPGHTADSISLVMCEGEKGVFTGDTVLGQGTTVFTDLASYMTSLKTLLALKPSVLYPAHGPHIPNRDECAKCLSDYITHRQERENQIVALLQKLSANPGMLGDAFVELVKEVEAAKAAELKYQHKLLGKTWNPPKPIDEKPKDDKAKDDKGKENGDKANEEAKEDKVKDGKAKNGDEDRQGDQVKEDTSDEYARIKAAFPSTERGITVPLICRLLYRTEKEGIIFAAGRSILAHLVKLEGEGKVRRVSVAMPEFVEMKVGEARVQEGWEWAGEAHPDDTAAKIKVD